MIFRVDEDGGVLISGTWDDLDEFSTSLRAILDKDETGSYVVGMIPTKTWRVRIIAEIQEEAA